MGLLVGCLSPVEDIQLASLPASTEHILTDFNAIDSALLQLSRQQQITPDRLCKAIDSIGQNDVEKAYAICSWLACNMHYDNHAFKTGQHPNQSAESVWKRGKGVCTGLSNLVVSLCSELDIEARVIKGYAKGESYFKNFDLNEAGHAWNKIKLNGKWELFDLTWSLKSCEHADNWFFVDPVEFGFTHLPFDVREQHVTLPISKTEFEALPVWLPEDFRTGMNAKQVLASFRSKEYAICGYPYQDVKWVAAPYQHDSVLHFEIKAPSNYQFRYFSRGQNRFEFFESNGETHTLQLSSPAKHFSILFRNPAKEQEEYLASYSTVSKHEKD